MAFLPLQFLQFGCCKFTDGTHWLCHLRELGSAQRLAAALKALGARRRDGNGDADLEGADFLGWQIRSFDTEAGPLDVVPLAAAIGGFEDVATIDLMLGKLSIRVIAINEVIASKGELGRPKVAALTG